MRFSGGVGVVVGGGLVLAGGVVGLMLAQTGVLSPADQDGGGTPGVSELTLTETVEGELTTRSPYNPNSGSRYQMYRVDLPPGDVVVFELSAVFPGVMALYDDRGYEVAAASAGYGNRTDMDLSYRSPEGGTYELAVSGWEPEDFGPLRVETGLRELDERAFHAPGDAISTWFDPNGTALDVTVDSAGYYRIDLDAGNEGVELAARPGSDSEVARTTGVDGRASLYVWLDEGEQALALSATGYTSPASGVVSLEAHQLDIDAESPAARETVLSDGERTALRQSGESITYTLELDDDQLVRVATRSDAFNPTLHLHGSGVDQYEGSQWGHGETVIESLLPPGRYELTVDAFQSETGGAYSLVVDTQSYDGGADAGLAPGGVVEARRFGGRDSTHELVIDEAGHYVIDMESGDFDTYLTLAGHGLHLENDDGGEHLNARIHALLEPGEYELTAGAFQASEHGMYTLSAETVTDGDIDTLRGPGSIDVGEGVSAVLPSGESNRHAVVIRGAGDYSIVLDDADFEAHVSLQGNGVNTSARQDFASATNRTVIEEPLEAGEYELEVRSGAGDEGGAYSLSVTR